MDGKFIEIESRQLYYLEQNPAAPETIFFFHGNSCSSNAWRKQWGSRLFSNYRLIAFDLPSHGKSDVVKSEDCSLPGLGRLLSIAVKQLSNHQPYILTGISLATNMVAEMLSYEIQPAGIVLAAPCIVGGEFTISKMAMADTHVGVVFQDDATGEDLDAYAKETSLSNLKDDFDYFKEDYVRVARPFRSLLAQSIFNGQMSDEVELLQKNHFPLLMIFGRDEKVVDPNYLDACSLNLWKGQIFKIAGASHFVNIDKADEFNLLLSQFAEEVFK